MRALDGQREDYERMADAARAKLLRTIDEIDHRRHEMLDVRYQVRRHSAALAIAGAGIALAASAVVAFAAHRARTRKQRLRRERVQVFARLWRHPDWVAPPAERSLPLEIGRKVLIGTATFAAMQVARRLVEFAIRLPAAPPPALPALPAPPTSRTR